MNHDNHEALAAATTATRCCISFIIILLETQNNKIYTLQNFIMSSVSKILQ